MLYIENKTDDDNVADAARKDAKMLRRHRASLKTKLMCARRMVQNTEPSVRRWWGQDARQIGLEKNGENQGAYNKRRYKNINGANTSRPK